MKKQTLIKISIPQPCSKNWEAMPLNEKGRFCQQCNKTIIDYTKFTDAQLFDFIRVHKAIPCGQFFSHQLDAAIGPPSKRKNEKNWFAKIAASIAAFLSLNSIKATVPYHPPGITMQPGKKINNDSLPAKITISGKITDGHGNKLEKAEIVFNGSKVAETNKEGSYSFELDDLSNKPYLIEFSYPGLASAARTFYPYMKSTVYDIALSELGQCVTHGGVPEITYLNFPDTTISFRINDKSLTAESKNLLEDLATEMRNVPDANVIISGEVASSKEISTCRNLLIAVLNKLNEHEGISAERIILIEEPVITKKQNMIRIESPKNKD